MPVDGPPVVVDAVSAVAVKLPPFWPDLPETWFAQAESQFHIKGVTSSLTKFHYCVAALPQDIASQLLDLIRNPPASEPFFALQNRLVRLYAMNEFQRSEQIVTLSYSGDQKPSNLMNRMLSLTPQDYKPDFLFRGLFLRRLSADVRSHLLHEDINDPLELALKADELWANSVTSPINAVHSEDCSSEVNAVHRGSNHPGRSGTTKTSSSSRRDQTPGPRAFSPTLCWYHRSHGENATKCKQPCSWSGN